MSQAEIYLFTGPEAGDKANAVSAIKEAARKKYGDLDEYKYYTSDVRVADVVAQLQGGSLFSASTFIVLRNAESIKSKEDIELLSSWVKASEPGPNTLILESEENSVDKKLENLVPSNHKKIFWEMFESDKKKWVLNYFKKNGFAVEDSAADQILDMVENNTEVLKTECSRFFFCFDKGHTVTVSDVDKILSHNREENAFTLFESMCDVSKNPRQRFELALEILQKIRLSKESNSISLIAGLTYCFRQLRAWHEVNSGMVTPTEAQLKAAGFAGKMNRTRYSNAAKIWSSGVTASIIALLSATDMHLRQEGMGLEDTRLTLMLYSIIIKNGIFPAEYEENWS